MRVLINALLTAGAKTGIGHYTSELLRCLRQQASPDAIHTFPAPWLLRARRAWSCVRPWLARSGTAPIPSGNWRGGLVRGLRRQGDRLLLRNFQAACRQGGYDLYHEPNYVPLPTDVPTVVTLCDLSVLLHPEWHPADRVAYFEDHFRRGLTHCVHFLAISEFGRQEIIQALGLRPERVTCAYMGVRPGLGPLPAEEVEATLARLGLPPRYLLYLGTSEPRKNVLTLLRAYTTLPASVRERYPLLLVGGWGWGAGSIATFLEEEGRHRNVRHLGYVADEYLPALYNGARALAFPSFYEGFGLPPVEMLACGGAVLASTAGAVAETAGACAHLIDPGDRPGWRDALLRVLTDDDWWGHLRQGAVEAARPFTWDRCAADTLAVYRGVAGRRVAA